MDHFQQAETLLIPLLTDYASDARYRLDLIVALDQVARRHPESARRAAATLLEELQRKPLKILPQSSDAAAAREQLDQIRAILAKLPSAVKSPRKP